MQFYTQAFQGQRELVKKARPVEAVLADPESKPIVKQKLTLTEDLRAFATEELGLSAKGQYDHYVQLDRRYVVWVVYAAPEFSTEAYRWWYPVVGSLKYRGFFREELAEKEAEKLSQQGYDVYMGGVSAYSTLGYLKDPLLNTFLGRDDAGLAELIFHELTHQRLYLRGDTDFNEALATVVGQEGARRWLRARNRISDLKAYEKEMRIEAEFVAETLRTRSELETLYTRQDLAPDQMRTEKKTVLQDLKRRLEGLNQRYGGSLKLDRWFEKPVNNARLNTIATYYDLVPEFEALLASHGGDLEAFFKHLEGMKDMEPRQRRAALRNYLHPELR